MSEQPATLSRNPNLCASCSSLADGMNEKESASAAVGSQRPTAAPSPSPPAGQKPALASERH
jgi:hypothetical protein